MLSSDLVTRQCDGGPRRDPEMGGSQRHERESQECPLLYIPLIRSSTMQNLMQELSNDEGKLPKYKGEVPAEEAQTNGTGAEKIDAVEQGGKEEEGVGDRVRKRARV